MKRNDSALYSENWIADRLCPTCGIEYHGKTKQLPTQGGPHLMCPPIWCNKQKQSKKQPQLNYEKWLWRQATC